MKWVLIKKFSELSGYTEEALRQKTKNGVWIYGEHFRKAPDGHIVINIEKVELWLQSI